MTAATVSVDGQSLPVFSQDTKLFPMDERVAFIANEDIAAVQQPLVDRILEVEAVARQKEPVISKANGGVKVRDLDGFNLPAFELLNARALALFKAVTGAPTAVVDDCWANVFRDGEYTMPHAHKRTMASVVYALDGGDEDAYEEDPMNGLLIFSDPRLSNCCIGKPGYVSTPFNPPKQIRNYMIIFPAQITHQVTPYYGERPRISIAWNIHPTKVAGELRHDGAMQ